MNYSKRLLKMKNYLVQLVLSCKILWRGRIDSGNNIYFYFLHRHLLLANVRDRITS